MRARVVIALLVAYAAATAIHIAYVAAHEPFAFDAWNVAVDTHAQPATVGRFFAFWADQYFHANPRFGQPLSYLAYKLAWFAPVMAALAMLAIAEAVVTLGLGRRPTTSVRDSALRAIAIGALWFALPQVGRNLFARAYATNYLYTAAIQLWFLVVVRRWTDASTPRVIAYAALGVIAGWCNEHTGPTLVLGLGVLAWWQRKQGERPRLAIAGAIGTAIGFALLFFAPGQDQRYGELAQQMSLPMRLLQRGLGGNLDILREWLGYAAPLIAIAAVVLVVAREETRGPRRLIAIALGAGVLMTCTLFVSPKLGSRFYIVPNALLLAAVIALIDAALSSRTVGALAGVAVIISGYAALRTVPLYRHVAAEGAARMADLRATHPGDVFVADAWDQVDETWWYIGDDFRDWKKRELVASYFGLTRVYFRGYDVKSPLGLSGTRLVATYRVTGDPIPHDDGMFDLGVTRGFDLAGIHASARDAVEILRARVGGSLESWELRVELAGPPPPHLPKPALILARWDHGAWAAPEATIKRRGRSTERGVILAPGVTGLAVFAAQIGGEVRALGEALRYTPWRSGVYWILGCDATECWVLAAARHAA